MTINEFGLNSSSNSDANIKLGDMAAQIALQNFDYRYMTLVFFNSSLYYGVELFLRVFNYNVIVNQGQFNSKYANISEQYVIFTSDNYDLELLLETLMDMKIVNTGKFIFVCQSTDVNDCDEQDIAGLLWEYRMVNAVFIKYETTQALGYTYYPFLEGECNNLKPIKLDSSNKSQYVTTSFGEIFKMKYRNFNFCPLIVSTFRQHPYMNITEHGIPTGADGDLLRIIAYGLRTTLKMITPHRSTGWGFRMKNGTWMGSLADLYEDLANMSMTSAALSLSRFQDFQISESYYASSVVWVTHPAKEQNEALRLVHPFAQSTRIALIVSYILVILCAFVVKSDKWSAIYQEDPKKPASRSVVFYSWMICMGQAVTTLPTKSVLLHIAMLWVHYCFIMRTVYQVYLISSLKGTFYEDQFETIEDAIKAKYPYGGGLALQDYYISNPLVFHNWKNVDASEILPTLAAISKGRKFVIAMNSDTAQVAIKKYKVPLHVLSQKVVVSPSVIFFKKYSPLSEPINVILSRLSAAGFPAKLHKDYTSFKIINSNNEQETLKLIHFAACYLVLVIGWAFSGVFFLLEIYFGKVYKHPMLSP